MPTFDFTDDGRRQASANRARVSAEGNAVGAIGD